MTLGGGEVDDAPAGEQVQRAVAEVVALDQRQDLAHRRPRPRADRPARSRRRSGPRWPAPRRPSCARSARRAARRGTPVTVMKTSPRSAASSAGMTAKPSMRASSARSGSTSQTITDAPKPVRPQRDAAAGPAVAEHDHGLPREQQVGRAQDAVEHRLAGAEAIVERALGARLVDGDDRHREPPFGLHRAQAHQPGGRLLGPAEHPVEQVRPRRVQRAQQVGAVVERDPRRALDDRRDAARPTRRARPAWTSASAASAAATSCCVANGLDAHSATSAPPACSVRTRIAVSDVTCRQAPTATPASGRSRAKRSRIERRTGICPSAHSIRAKSAV